MHSFEAKEVPVLSVSQFVVQYGADSAQLTDEEQPGTNQRLAVSEQHKEKGGPAWMQ